MMSKYGGHRLTAEGKRLRRKHKSPSKVRWVSMKDRWNQQDALDRIRARRRAEG